MGVVPVFPVFPLFFRPFFSQQSYPSTRVIDFSYDSAGRISGLDSGSTTYASNFLYAPHGAIEELTLGNGYKEKATYNYRLQPSYLWLDCGNVTACVNPTYSPWKIELLYYQTNPLQNNGNIGHETLWVVPLGSSTLEHPWRQSYSYDGANRLSQALEFRFHPITGIPSTGTIWQRNYSYDRFGNRAATNGTGGGGIGPATPQSLNDFDTATNRLKPAFGADYDAVGNQTKNDRDGGMMDWTAAYDANNKQRFYCAGTTSDCSSSNATAEYIYDGDGARVGKITAAAGTTVYVYDAFGKLAAEYSQAPHGAKGGVHYRTTDHLGSTRIVTDQNGAIVSRRDFFPFGEEILASAAYGNRQTVKDGQATTTYNVTSGFRQQFTSKERDSETGLDYFGARYMSSAQGRSEVDPQR